MQESWFTPWVGKICWRRKWQPTPVFFLENPTHREASQATVHGVTKSWTRLKKQYVNHKLPDVQAGFRKGVRTRDQIANIHWITEKAIEFQKNKYFCFVDYAKAFDCVDDNKLWKILQEMGIPDHLT